MSAIDTRGTFPTDGWVVGPTDTVQIGTIGCPPTEHAFQAVQSYIGNVSMVVGVLCPKCGEYRPVPTPEMALLP